MSELSVGYTELSHQASMTAQGYLRRAIDSVEEVMGKGAASMYPGIVAAVVAAAASDYAAAMVSHRLVPAIADISDALGNVADAVARSSDV